ncbi:hypothetical protein [Nocardia abscessus]|uniref:hypothetical protein n=1 Tax=Nocardia abscessus TaxID=120957 RepID=UPI001E2EBF5E|nr:hypothetical protein [Nocardia abscessus]
MASVILRHSGARVRRRREAPGEMARIAKTPASRDHRDRPVLLIRLRQIAAHLLQLLADDPLFEAVSRVRADLGSRRTDMLCA